MGVDVSWQWLRSLTIDKVQGVAAEWIGGVEDARLALGHTGQMVPPGLIGVEGL